MAVMAIAQNIDKCIRCNGCYIACKRTWNMKDGDIAAGRGLHKVAPYQRVVIKSVRKVDMGPFMRYSCWHCTLPACAGQCPFRAIKKEATGAVSVDVTKCNPSACMKQCVSSCQRGGYPKVGVGTYPTGLNAGMNKAWKCTLCHGRAGADGDLPTHSTAGEIAAEPNLAHWPACAYTCPAKAYKYGTRASIMAELAALKQAQVAAGKPFAATGEGSMFWYTLKANAIMAPKADPFIEDHVTPMVSGILASPLAKAAIVPTLVVGGLMALSARRAENEKDLEPAMEGEV